MAKQKFERTKPHVNIGTIGHERRIAKRKSAQFWAIVGLWLAE